MLSIIFVPLALVAASSWIYVLTSWAPAAENLKFPSTFEELQEIALILQEYQQANGLYIFVLFCSAYLYKQTFAIPGSVFLNILSGALFGLVRGFILTCTLTACGATFCFLLSKHCGKQYVTRFFPERVAFLQKKVDENRTQLPFFLLFLRFFPMTPNWFLNIASPVANIPLHLFFVSVFIGLMPYNFICVQTGVILTKIHSLNKVFTTGRLLTMATIAVASLIPGIVMKRFQHNFS